MGYSIFIDNEITNQELPEEATWNEARKYIRKILKNKNKEQITDFIINLLDNSDSEITPREIISYANLANLNSNR